MSDTLIPAGYLYKRVAGAPAWLGTADHIAEIHSVSSCMSPAFADYVAHWQHNGFWFFDEPSVMQEVAQAERIDLLGATLFYFEVYPLELNETTRAWSPITADGLVAVSPPKSKTLRGFDVCTFSQRNLPECSPLSCNRLCETLVVNRYCLFDSLKAAKAALNDGAFDHSEPGPFRIFAVYTAETTQKHDGSGRVD